MIEGLDAVNRIFKTIDTGITKHSHKINSSGFEDMMEFSPEALAAARNADAIYQEMGQIMEPLKDLVSDALKEQYSLSGEKGQSIQEKAQELLDGYFSAENTADRIFSFAFSTFDGGDREEFAAKMKGYIDEGFAQAEKMLGGLADISLETRDLISQKIDDFISEGKEKGDQVSEVA
jgi:ElaB/YqjD/DUF883 family membrane-anchored ribosome-binding protein